ncbi:MAG: hypothetical protein AAF645_08600, partial [Myxococcota bacterium]
AAGAAAAKHDRSGSVGHRATLLTRPAPELKENTGGSEEKIGPGKLPHGGGWGLKKPTKAPIHREGRRAASTLATKSWRRV